MTSAEIVPRGGYLRGMLSGTVVSSLAIIALSTAYDSTRFSRNSEPVPDVAIVAPVSAPPPNQITPPTEESGIVAPMAASPVTPVVPQTPAAIETGTAVEIAPASQTTLERPETASIEASGAVPVVAVTPVEVTNVTPQAVPVSPVVPEPTEIVAVEPAVVEKETETAVIATPVTPLSDTVEADAGESAQPTVVTALANGTIVPTTVAPVQVDAADTTTESTPADTQSAPNPAGNVVAAGQGSIVADTGPTTAGSPVATYGAIADYGQDYVLPADKPGLSIILLAEEPADVEHVRALSAPVTLAVRADNPQAAEIIRAYRVAGGEVIMFVPQDGSDALPKGGDAGAGAQSLVAQLARLPGVIGVADGPEGVLPQDAKLLEAVLPALAEKGYGLVTTNGLGLNRAEIMAGEAGVPAVSISRQVDADPGKIQVIRQMDKAVLGLSQNGRTVVFGHASSDVLSALKFWLKSNKAQSTTIAPVSALLREKI